MELEVRGKFEEVTKKFIEKGAAVTTMESCTGGLIASLITDTEGASAIMKGAFVTYSNEAKIMQGIPAQILDNYGVYSEETAIFMALTCRKTYNANIGIGVTGTFGNIDPSNSEGTPGEVYFAIDSGKKTKSFKLTISPQDSRHEYKIYVANEIADRLLELLAKPNFL